MTSIVYTVEQIPFTSDVVDPVVDTTNLPILPDENGTQYKIIQSTLMRSLASYHYDASAFSNSFVSWIGECGLNIAEYLYYFVPAGTRTGSTTPPLSPSLGSSFLLLTKAGDDGSIVLQDPSAATDIREVTFEIGGEQRISRGVFGTVLDSRPPLETLFITPHTGYVLDSQNFLDVRANLYPIHVWCIFFRDRVTGAKLTQQELALRFQ